MTATPTVPRRHPVMAFAADMPALEDALCNDFDEPDLWFADEFRSPNRHDVALAKTICGQCPERLRCLQWALDHHERHGIWGGLTAAERGMSHIDGRKVRVCDRCGSAYHAKSSGQRYCSTACSGAARAEKRQKYNDKRKPIYPWSQP